MSFAIITDSAANLPGAILRKYDLTVVPLTYYMRGVEYTCADPDTFDGELFYNAMRGKTEVTTSLANTQRFVDYMNPILGSGRDVLFAGISSGISGSFASAVSAAAQLAEQYPQRTIRLVDTLSASLGEGLLVMRAGELREQGLSLNETADLLMEERRRMCQLFTVDDLMFLHRGGRVSKAVAVAGTILHIKPLLKGDADGKIKVYGKVRGRKNAFRALTDSYEKYAVEPEKQTVAIAHCGCAAEAEDLASMLCDRRRPRDILIACYEPVTGAHVGPGAVALFFMAEDGIRKI